MKLIIGPSKILETPCRPDFLIPRGLIPGMFHLLTTNQGLGLAAPQVGVDARFFITIWDEVFINPVITWRGEYIRTLETCLSFPGVVTNMKRCRVIKVGGVLYKGLQAIVIQHELDHLNGLHIAMGGIGDD